MEYVKMLDNAIDYTKEAFWGRWIRWILLIISVIIFPLGLGYLVRVMGGGEVAPEFENPGTLFVNGLKLFVVYAGYFGVVLIPTFTFFAGTDRLIQRGSAAYFVFLVILVMLFIYVWLVAQIAAVRFARTGVLREGFNISAILGHIRAIGWGPYILSQIILNIVLGIFISIPFTAISLFGYFLFGDLLSLILELALLLVLHPVTYVLIFRYNTLVYDNASVS